MNFIIEIIIVILAGIASVSFLAWYFYSSAKKPGKCSGCSSDQIEYIKKYLKQKQAEKNKSGEDNIIPGKDIIVPGENNIIKKS